MVRCVSLRSLERVNPPPVRGDQLLFPRTSEIKTLLLPKFLRVFRELFIKSFLNGVGGNAPNNALMEQDLQIAPVGIAAGKADNKGGVCSAFGAFTK